MDKRKVILNLCTSLDSLVEGINGDIDWCLTDQDYSMTEFLDGIDSIFIGRRSYEQLKQLAPNAFADKKMIVFSTTMQQDESDDIIIHNIEEVSKILNEPGKNIWLFGGPSLITKFLNLQLVDELMISVHPLILGNGKPLFSDIKDRIQLELTDTKTFSTGLVQLYYKVVNL